jgi:hypothetical protein
VVLVGCGGPAFESASLAVSPGDGGLSEDPLTGLDGARGSGLDATSGDTGGDGDEVSKNPSAGWDSPEASSSSLDSHVADPWPADVVIEPMPAPNCFLTWGGQLTCCYGPNVPLIDCARQNQAHHCDQCPSP